jgi:hypothetical protein
MVAVELLLARLFVFFGLAVDGSGGRPIIGSAAARASPTSVCKALTRRRTRRCLRQTQASARGLWWRSADCSFQFDRSAHQVRRAPLRLAKSFWRALAFPTPIDAGRGPASGAFRVGR